MTLLGAGKVFSSEDSTVTDKDIEDILDKREKTMTQPKAKIQKIAKDSIKFSWNKHNCYWDEHRSMSEKKVKNKKDTIEGEAEDQRDPLMPEETEWKGRSPCCYLVDYMDTGTEARREDEIQNEEQEPGFGDLVGVIANRTSVPTYESCMPGKGEPPFSSNRKRMARLWMRRLRHPPSGRGPPPPRVLGARRFLLPYSLVPLPPTGNTTLHPTHTHTHTHTHTSVTRLARRRRRFLCSDRRLCPAVRRILPICIRDGAAPRRCPDGGGDDRISALPNKMLLQILIHLRCARAAAHTSSLSRRWHGLWRHLFELSFCDMPLDAVDAALQQVACPALSRLEIEIPERHMILDPARVSALLNAAAGLAPADLIIDVWGHCKDRDFPIQTPSFERAASIKLRVVNLYLTLPAGDNIEFPALERVSVAGCRVDNIAELIRRCPNLRVLEVCGCWGLDTVKIHSSSIEELVLDNSGVLGNLDIVAPVLERARVASHHGQGLQCAVLRADGTISLVVVLV
nr:uncharacterized protein LOC127304186 [Lolium perenne]